jgi:hypothetical protein
MTRMPRYASSMDGDVDRARAGWIARLRAPLIFIAGAAIGATLMALLGPIRSDLAPEVSAAGIVLLGALLAAMFAFIGVDMASSRAREDNIYASRTPSHHFHWRRNAATAHGSSCTRWPWRSSTVGR